MAIYEMGAAGATIERAVVSWMLGKVGFGPGSDGVLTHGGSLANLTALLAARARVAPDAWRAGTPGDLALLAPPSAHYSVRRAAAILGLGEDAVLELEVDELDASAPSGSATHSSAAGRPGDGRSPWSRPPARPAPASSTTCAQSGPSAPPDRNSAARRRSPRRLGVAVGAPPRPPRRHRAGRLCDLGRAQAAAHLGSPRRCVDAPRAGRPAAAHQHSGAETRVRGTLCAVPDRQSRPARCRRGGRGGAPTATPRRRGPRRRAARLPCSRGREGADRAQVQSKRPVLVAQARFFQGERPSPGRPSSAPSASHEPLGRVRSSSSTSSSSTARSPRIAAARRTP